MLFIGCDWDDKLTLVESIHIIPLWTLTHVCFACTSSRDYLEGERSKEKGKKWICWSFSNF